LRCRCARSRLWCSRGTLIWTNCYRCPGSRSHTRLRSRSRCIARRLRGRGSRSSGAGSRLRSRGLRSSRSACLTSGAALAHVRSHVGGYLRCISAERRRSGSGATRARAMIRNLAHRINLEIVRPGSCSRRGGVGLRSAGGLIRGGSSAVRSRRA
jgi:hypothetical protein